MDKFILDPGEIIEGPGRGGPPEFVKVESGEGWQSKWVGSDEAREGGVPEEALPLLDLLDDANLEGLLLPAVQAMSEHVPFTFLKLAQKDAESFEQLVEQGAFDQFDDLLVLAPGGSQAAFTGFLKLDHIEGESRDTPDTGAWTPLSDFSDVDPFV